MCRDTSADDSRALSEKFETIFECCATPNDDFTLRTRPKRGLQPDGSSLGSPRSSLSFGVITLRITVGDLFQLFNAASLIGDQMKLFGKPLSDSLTSKCDHLVRANRVSLIDWIWPNDGSNRCFLQEVDPEKA